MEYCEFRNAIIGKLQELAGHGVHVSGDVVSKNNGIVLETLLFKDGRSNVAPLICLKPWHERMQSFLGAVVLAC